MLPIALNLIGVEEETKSKHTDQKFPRKGGAISVIQIQWVNIPREDYVCFLPPKVESTETYIPHLLLKVYTELLVFLRFSHVTGHAGSDGERPPSDTTGHLEQGALDCVHGSSDRDCGNPEAQAGSILLGEKVLASGI